MNVRGLHRFRGRHVPGGAWLIAISLILTACGESSDGAVGPDPEEEPEDSPPSVTVTNPADGSTISNVVEIRADATDDGTVSSVEFLVGGGRVETDFDGSDGWSASWNTTLVADGDHTVVAKATDDIGQTATNQTTVIVDNASVSGSWARKASLGGVTRDRAVALSIGDKGYVGLGQGTVPGTYKDFWEYDPETDSWTQKADFGGDSRDSPAGFTIGDRGYVGTGNNLKDFWEYDPGTNTWIRKADFAGPARFGAVGVSIGGKGYIGTGRETETGEYLSDFWKYDPSTDAWTRRADVPGPPRRHGVAFAIGDRGYLGLGWSTGHDEAFQDFYEYDPSTDTWTRIADLAGFGRVWAAGFSIGGKGYVGTGNRGRPRPAEGPDRLTDFWEYDPSVDTWLRRADWPTTPRLAPVGFSIGGRGYMGTGWDGDEHHRDLWEYTPVSE